MNQIVKKTVYLNVYGFDLVVEQEENNNSIWYLIDLNYFPGFKNVPNYRKILEDLF